MQKFIEVANKIQSYDTSSFFKHTFIAIAVFYSLKFILNWITCPEIYGRDAFKKGRYDTDTYRRRQLDTLRARCAQFPKPYPNGWYKLCESEELKVDQVTSFSALGREFVAFRNKKGEVGVLNAFCPHLGTHLGHGGVINKKGNLVCPYHLWEFNPKGKNEGIPYCKKDMSNSNRVNAKGYVVYESKPLKSVFFWFHADQLGKNAQHAHRETEEPEEEKMCYDEEKKLATVVKGPLWQIHSGLFEVEELIKKGEVKHATTMPWGKDCLMHILEPSQNTADEFHFSTVHQYLPLPFNLNLLKLGHSVLAIYGNEPDARKKAAQTGIKLGEKEMILIENVEFIRVGDLFNLPSVFASMMTTIVHMAGPNNILFRVSTPFGKLFCHYSLIPVEPFRQRSRMKMYADKKIPWIISKLLTWWIMETVNQDMQVWEHKLQISPRNLVLGDGPFARYGKWLDTFYSDRSLGWESFQPGCLDKMDW
eukprot:augustus_masked-scaffold_6-processed-gene-18.53-mRNA-1 protein AED:1.00 eAED:1.00 QI:0/-1/0/0/-1/1/1/0/477